MAETGCISSEKSERQASGDLLAGKQKDNAEQSTEITEQPNDTVEEPAGENGEIIENEDSEAVDTEADDVAVQDEKSEQQAVVDAEEVSAEQLVEEAIKNGGIGEHFGIKLMENDYNGKYIIKAIENQFVPQATVNKALEKLGFTVFEIEELLKN